MEWAERVARFEGIGTFPSRCIALLAFASLVSALDFARHRERATRWREYALLLLAAATGAACGALNDAITSMVSPDYFVLAKGIPAGEGLHARAMLFGVEAGAGFGALLGGVLLIAAGRGFTADRAALRRVVRACITIPAWALATGSVALVVAAVSRVSISWFRDGTGRADETARGMTTVWLGHLGVHAGALFGTVLTVRELRRLRRHAAR